MIQASSFEELRENIQVMQNEGSYDERVGIRTNFETEEEWQAYFAALRAEARDAGQTEMPL